MVYRAQEVFALGVEASLCFFPLFGRQAVGEFGVPVAQAAGLVAFNALIHTHTEKPQRSVKVTVIDPKRGETCSQRAC